MQPYVSGPQGLLAVSYEPPPRPLSPRIEVMQFWNDIFPGAIASLKELPSHAYRDSAYDIRNLTKWEDVYAVLSKARASYEYCDPGLVERFRKKVRVWLDKSTPPLQQAVKFIPDIDIASPIVGAVKVLLEVGPPRTPDSMDMLLKVTGTC